MIRGLLSKHRYLLIGLLTVFCLVACNRPAPTANLADAPPNVAATTTILAGLTREIAGNSIQLSEILKPGASPHTYEPVAEDKQTLQAAKLILYNGYNLEPGLLSLINSPDIKNQKLSVAEAVSSEEVQKNARKITDPHVWGDARNTIAMVITIRDALIELSPLDRDRITENAIRLRKQLEQLDEWIRNQIETIPSNQRKLVTTHNAFQYYSKAYGLTIAGTLNGVNGEKPPSKQVITQLADSVSRMGVPVIFAETTTNLAGIKAIAQQANVKLASQQLYTDSIGAPGSNGDSYVKMMVVNTSAIVEALGGKTKPFQPKLTE